MLLSELKNGEKAIIVKILGHGAFRKRVMEMGFVRGREVKALLTAPLQDPIKYSVMGYEVSLRRAEAAMIECVSVPDWKHHLTDRDNRRGTEKSVENPDSSKPDHIRHDKIINVALIGNPNCGKTSLFNAVSGSHEHVGNYAGVTVDAKEGYLNYKGYRINVVDLPGTYSMSAYSPEEQYVMRYLMNEPPDVIVNVAVASNLERNLYLTTELIDMNRSMVIALNMYDELEKSHAVLDYELLSKLLGVPIVPTVASSGKGIHKLLDTVIDVYEMRNPDTRHIHVPLGADLEKSVSILKEDIKGAADIPQEFSPRYIAIKMLEGDPEMKKVVDESASAAKIEADCVKELERLKHVLPEDAHATIAAEKYGFISGALKETLTQDIKQEHRTTSIIDAFVTNRLFGFPLFLLVMWFMFWATFTIGQYPMDWIEEGVAFLGDKIGEWMSPGPLRSLLLDGVIGGVGGVIVFLPNILILYALISFMEDSGYMARVAFIMDKVMHRMGLHGKSFIPLVMGFGCNVPAIISTRIIESRSSRLLTILIIPFMSCSARIPIYVLLCGCFFPEHAGTVFFGLYVLGIVIAVLTAKLLRKFWLKKDDTPFVMELPPYRMPTAKATMRGMWEKARQYLKKMGGLILVASIIIWALSYFPHYDEQEMMQSPEYSTLLTEAQAEAVTQQQASGIAANMSAAAPVDTAAMLSMYQQSESYLGHIGHFVEPVMKPLGFDWKPCVALIAGSAAKEVVVSTLGVLYAGDDEDEARLSERLVTPSPVTHKPPFTPLTAMSFLIFVLVYFPCIATIAAIGRECGSWKYAWFSVIYNTALAYLLSLIVYQVGMLF